jgi:hypothetical protein
MRPGWMNGLTGVVIDHSPAGKHGTITGSTLRDGTPWLYERPVSPASRLRRVTATTPATFQPAWARGSNVVLQPGVL